MKTLTAAATCAALLAGTSAGATELVGAVQFDENHAFTKALREFERVAGECSGGSLTFELHLNSELGLEKDYFENMSQGIAVDYGIVSPSHMSTFSQKAPLMDMPFLFRDLDHWNAVMEQDALAPLAEDVLDKANVRLIGYAGGGTRNLIVNKPVTTMAELEGLPMRVMGAPIQTRIFEAIKAAPSVIAYDEVYNAIQTGVIDAARKRGGGHRTDEVLRGRPRDRADQARDHRAPHRLLERYLRTPDARRAGLRPAGRQGRRQAGPRRRKRSGQREAEGHGRGGALEDPRVHRARHASGTRRAGQGRLCRGTGRDRRPAIHRSRRITATPGPGARPRRGASSFKIEQDAPCA
ncbi:TRAP transporter substrate-binding protein DctP [Ponticoccus litoralis]|uniref:TRAP transporter substrate-binding protein n=1 Tax=Ponticoccus litoralis TaxID=422297 RepID=UPI003D2EB633